MRKTKAKNDSFWQVGTVPFVALWAATYALGWFIALNVYEWIERLLASFQAFEADNFAAVITVTFIPAVLQVPLIERLLKQRMRGWIPTALVASLLTGFVFTNYPQTNWRFVISVMSLFVPIALLQTVWLHRRVHSAWLWALTSVVASLVFSIPIRSVYSSKEITTFAGLLYGIVQGVIMRYLWMQPKITEKAKTGIAEDSTFIDRTGRLQGTAEIQDPRFLTDASEKNVHQSTR